MMPKQVKTRIEEYKQTYPERVLNKDKEQKYLMVHFLFQLSPINGVKFKPIKIYIHQGVIKIVDDKIFYDFQLNTTESVIVGTDRDDVLEKVQRGFESILSM